MMDFLPLTIAAIKMLGFIFNSFKGLLRYCAFSGTINSNASTGQVTAIKQLQTITATRIRSANNSINPMNIEMVYSAFKLNH